MEPFGAIRDNLHAAMITAAIVNANRAPRTPAISPDHFMYRSPKERDALARAKALEQFNAVVAIVDRAKEHGTH